MEKIIVKHQSLKSYMNYQHPNEDESIHSILDPDDTAEEFKAMEDIYHRLMKKKIKYKLMKNELERCPKLQKLYNEVEQTKDEMKPWILVTINCKEGEWIEVFTKLKHISSWIWLKDALISVEQRGDTEATCGHLPHFHILIKSYDIECPRQSGAKGKCWKRFWDKFGSHCGNEKSIWINRVEHKFKDDKINYLTGKKIDSDKLEKQKIDKFFRKKYGIEPYYTLDTLPTSVSKPRGGIRVGAGRPKKVKPELEKIQKKTLITF